MCDIIHIIHK